MCPQLAHLCSLFTMSCLFLSGVAPISLFPLVSSFCHPSWQVKADKGNPNLARLQNASCRVTQAAARLVASGKYGKSHMEEMGKPEMRNVPETLISLRAVNCFGCVILLFRHFRVLLIQIPWTSPA